MTKRLTAKLKAHRSYSANITGSAKSPFAKRAYRPGQHGQSTREKPSKYAEQLRAKQTLRAYHGPMGEKQFKNIYKLAQKMKGDTGENFLSLLGRRLDCVVYNLKWAPSIFAARQFVVHGHIRVNGRKVDIPSYRLRPGDELTLKEDFRQNVIITNAVAAKDREVPSYITCDSGSPFKATFSRIPQGTDIPYPFQPSMYDIIEFYS